MSGYYNQGPPPPNQSYSPYPPQQQGGYPPPQQGYNQGYPHQQQGYNQGPPPPMNQGYNQGWNQPPPQGNYGPPGGQQTYPPHQQGGGYQQQYQQPPPQGGNYGPPPGQYGGGPPQGNYGGPGPAAPPSLGYVPGQQANMDMSRAADDLRKAMKGFGTDEKELIRVLASLDPLQVASVKQAFHARHHRHLTADVESETSGHFREALLAILRGPLDQDCHALHQAIDGLGTKESALDDVLLARSNADMHAIKRRYHEIYHRTLEADVKGDLSMKTERLFEMVLAARRNEESSPVIPQQIDADVQAIYGATEGRSGTDQLTVCDILATRSNGQIRAIAMAYQQKFRRPLDEVVRKEFSGHMEHSLIFMLRAAEDPAKHDADLLEEAMKGAGTKDHALIRRIIAIHWDRQRLQQCKAAYKHFHKRELATRVKDELSGDYERLMVACLA